MGTRILRGPVVKDGADRPDSAVAGDQLRGAAAIPELPAGVIGLSDPRVRATARGVPAAVAWPIAHRGRVTWLDARGKVDNKGRLLRAAVAAVTRGQRFLERPTIAGHVLWVSEEAVADVKRQLAEVDADLDKVFFTRGLRPDTDHDHESSLPRLVALLRPIWVVIDPWRHYLQVQRVTAAAGPGAEKLLLGDIVDWAREYETAFALSHDNAQNRPGAYTDSAVLGAADMVVTLGPGQSPTTLRLQPSGRWRLDPVDIGWSRGRGYWVVKGSGRPGRSRTDERPIDERVVLHLGELGADGRVSARRLASSLECGGRRYEGLKESLERLLADRIVDHAQRSGDSSGRGRGYALTERGHLRAECLRQASDSGASTNREGLAEGCSETVSEGAFPAVGGSGDATAAAGDGSAEDSFGDRFRGCVSGGGRKRNQTAAAGNGSAEGCSETVSEDAFPGVGGSRNATAPGVKVSAARSEGASVSGRAGHVGDDVVGHGRTEPASRRSCTRLLEDRVLHLLRSHGAGEPRLMFRTVLTLFRLSGHSVERVRAAFDQLVSDGFVRTIPSNYYPEPLYALTERGRHRVAGSKGATAAELP